MWRPPGRAGGPQAAGGLRQDAGLKHFFANRNCTVLLLDDQTSSGNDLQLHSIAHGVITLEQTAQDFGTQRRRLRVVKMRGIKFRGGFHDFSLDTGGIDVFPSLVAAEHRREFAPAFLGTGSAELDQLLGGGLTRGTNTLLMGPSGVGKTTTAIRCILSALERGQNCAYFLFDEGLTTLLARADSMSMTLQPFIDNGQLSIRQIDPAEVSPGEFSSWVRKAVMEDEAAFVVIDSLNAYLQAMPGEKYLLLQMHELLNYLNQLGVATLLVLGQHGLVGDMRTDVDLSYLSDTILLFRFFEAKGQILTALSVVKSRASAHERTIREFRLGPTGVRVGEALTDFQGVMAGVPAYRGQMAMLPTDPAASEQLM